MPPVTALLTWVTARLTARLGQRNRARKTGSVRVTGGHQISMKAFLLPLSYSGSSVVANATDVVRSAQTVSQIPFNPSNIGSDRINHLRHSGQRITDRHKRIAFSVKHRRAAGLPSIGGVQYTVAFVSSTFSLTLTTNYAAAVARVNDALLLSNSGCGRSSLVSFTTNTTRHKRQQHQRRPMASTR